MSTVPLRQQMHFSDYVQLPEGEIMCTHMMHLHICLFGDKSKTHPATSPVRARLHTKNHTECIVYRSLANIWPLRCSAACGTDTCACHAAWLDLAFGGFKHLDRCCSWEEKWENKAANISLMALIKASNCPWARNDNTNRLSCNGNNAYKGRH